MFNKDNYRFKLVGTQVFVSLFRNEEFHYTWKVSLTEVIPFYDYIKTKIPKSVQNHCIEMLTEFNNFLPIDIDSKVDYCLSKFGKLIVGNNSLSVVNTVEAIVKNNIVKIGGEAYYSFSEKSIQDGKYIIETYKKLLSAGINDFNKNSIDFVKSILNTEYIDLFSTKYKFVSPEDWVCKLDSFMMYTQNYKDKSYNIRYSSSSRCGLSIDYSINLIAFLREKCLPHTWYENIPLTEFTEEFEEFLEYSNLEECINKALSNIDYAVDDKDEYCDYRLNYIEFKNMNKVNDLVNTVFQSYTKQKFKIF